MSLEKLENDNLIIEICDFGAELSTLYSKKHDKDLLWCGDAKYWGRKSPVLFPIVGKLKDNETIIDNNTYSMGQHGFARDCKFNLISKTNKSLTYSLLANEETKTKFPYDFELNITYILNHDNVEIQWNVKNNDVADMYFSIGAHPAFNIPFNKGDSLEDYFLTYETRDVVEEFILEAPYIKEKNNLEKLDSTTLRTDLFKNDALVYSGVNKVVINSNTNNITVALSFNDFPFVGIWSPYYEATNSIAPFICIEPWYGIADLKDSKKNFKEKLGINKLRSKEEFNSSYQIIINQIIKLNLIYLFSTLNNRVCEGIFIFL